MVNPSLLVFSPVECLEWCLCLRIALWMFRSWVRFDGMCFLRCWNILIILARREVAEHYCTDDMGIPTPLSLHQKHVQLYNRIITSFVLWYPIYLSIYLSPSIPDPAPACTYVRLIQYTRSYICVRLRVLACACHLGPRTVQIQPSITDLSRPDPMDCLCGTSHAGYSIVLSVV